MFESMLLMNAWKVNYDDIEPLKAGKKGGSTVRNDLRTKLQLE